MTQKVLLVVGPTGIGKTDLSLEIAERLDAEIISADSRQVYKLMDIGTAKPSAEQLRRVPHHFIDIRFPDEYYSAGEFGQDARRCVQELAARGKAVLVVGGSGFYIRALVDGLFGPKIADAEVKAHLRERLQREGLPALYAELQRVDPNTAARLHATDTQRILRALEVFTLTGVPLSEHWQKPPEPAPFEPVFVGLTMNRRNLYARIEARVDEMIARGLVDEVKELLARGYSPDLNALRTVGYREVVEFLQNQRGFEETVGLIKQHTRNYAKRQFTWFRKDKRIRWFDLDEPDAVARVLEFARRTIRG